MALAFLSMQKFHHLHASFVSVLSQLRRHTSPAVNIFVYLPLAALGLRCVWLSSAAVRGLLSSRQAGPAVIGCAAGSGVPRLQQLGHVGLGRCSLAPRSTGLTVVVRGLHRPTARGAAPDQELILHSPALAGGLSQH